ncbi:MAG: hypothetical protein AB1405_18025, partial [Bdellovibrionota bacterium]
RYQWVQVGERNEALDVRAYNICGYHILAPQSWIHKLSENLKAQAARVAQGLPPPAPKPAGPRIVKSPYLGD